MKTENFQVTGTPVKTWKRESPNFPTDFRGSTQESRTLPPRNIFALPLYDGGGFHTFKV